jgi:hypothetical protein
VGRFRQRGPALPIRFSHGDLVWDQVAIRLLCIRCDVLRPISGSRRLKSMDRRLFTVMLHEVEKRANEVYALRKDVGFTGEQIFVLFRYTFGHPMIDVLAIRQTYLLSEIFGNANVLCF